VKCSRLALVGLLVLAGSSVDASDIVEVQPLTDQILMVHCDDGFVEHHKIGQPRSQEVVHVDPLDTAAAQETASYRLSSDDDPAYREPKRPTRVGRKSKGTDFAWFADTWEDGRAVNHRPDHASEHWLYLVLPSPLVRGKTYRLDTGGLAKNGATWTLTFDERTSRSEAVHVNLLGYAPEAPRKVGDVSHWMGDLGSLPWSRDVDRRFLLVSQPSGKVVYHGQAAFRAPADQPETGQAHETPHGNYQNADTLECDFSEFRAPGQYVLAVQGIGCSFPFRIEADVYRPAFTAVARALYHNRSGIELKAPYTEFARPAPHNPRQTPGFAGKLLYTTVRWPEWGSEGGDPKALLAGSKGPLDAWGWYQDAGDWDSYDSHIRVPQELLLAYELAPGNFRDGDLNLPESGNGLPDLLDEAAWLPRFLFRLRHELLEKGYGTGGVALRIAGDAFGSDEGTRADGQKIARGSWQDTDRTWVVSGENPWTSYAYAGAAAHLAALLKRLGTADPEGVDWRREAVESYAWASQNTRPGDADGPAGESLHNARAYAAAALWRLTGEASYEQAVREATADVTPTTLLTDAARYAPFLYTLPGAAAKPDPELVARLRRAVLFTADQIGIEVPAKRALRWAGNWWMPMLGGQQTTPLALEVAVGEALTRDSDPKKARAYRAALYTTADYFLGGNPLNLAWITGIGPRHPNQVFHLDAWYNGKDRFHPGLIPYGPWRKQNDRGQGPWDADWPNPTLHPPIDAWPGAERWYDNRCSPTNSEFTIHQNLGPAAAIYGLLCAPWPSTSP
jgi:hypothetical protein